MAINSITITQVNVSYSANDPTKYDLKVFWTQDESAQSTLSNYWLIIYKNMKEDSKISFTGAGSYSFTELSFNLQDRYEVALTASTTKCTPCNKVSLLFDTYKNIGAEYTNSNIKLTWEQISAITIGRAIFQSEGYPSRSYIIPGDVRHINIDISDIDLKSKTLWKCSLLPAKTETSWGPVPDEITFYVETAKLLSVDVESTKIKILYTLSDTAYAKKEKIYAKIVLLDGDKTVFSTKQAIVSEQTDKQFLIEAHVTDEFVAANLSLFKLAVYIGTENAMNITITGENCTPLSVPALTFDYVDGKKVELSWKHEADGCTGYTVYKNGAVLSDKIYEKKCLVDAADVLNDNLVVSPDYGSIRGVPSPSVKVFREGFYPSDDGFCFYANEYGEGITSVTLSRTIFEDNLTGEVSNRAFSIRPEGAGCKLSFDRNIEYQSEDFDSFLNKLFEEKLTVFGYYEIKNILSRIVSTDSEKALYIYASMKKDALYADVVPGTILRAETAVYQRQLGVREDDSIGYIYNAVARYPVTLGDTGGMDVLEFGKYIGFLAGSYMGAGAPDDPTRYNYGGQIDLFNINVRQPFMRILYPSAIPDSHEPGTPYASKNVLLLTAATLEILQINTKAERTEITTPYVVLRGRSTVVSEITVFVNDSPTLVELGTKLDELLNRYSCSDSSLGIRMFRETGADVGLVEVFLNLNDRGSYAKDLALLPGDKIYR